MTIIEKKKRQRISNPSITVAANALCVYTYITNLPPLNWNSMDIYSYILV